ncbi:MAG TPA: type II toxin-antitoxin system HicA family toxin [Actinomycetota bacterium]|nr:type II toxin-antitoxin system HicA family toxin [Actinomycetota bacterium]
MEPGVLWETVNGGEILNVSFNDFRRLIEACGFTFQGPRGNRLVFTHRSISDPLVLQPLRNQDTKPDEILKFLDIAREHGLSPR